MKHTHHCLLCKDSGSVPKNFSSKENPRIVKKSPYKNQLKHCFSPRKWLFILKLSKLTLYSINYGDHFPEVIKHGFPCRLKRQEMSRECYNKGFMLKVFESNNALTIQKHIKIIQYNSDTCLKR